MKKLISGTTVIGLELKQKFQEEVFNYAELLDEAIKGNSNKIVVPSFSINDILAKYIVLGTASLQEKGVYKTRAKSVARYTFENILESVIKDIEGKGY